MIYQGKLLALALGLSASIVVYAADSGPNPSNIRSIMDKSTELDKQIQVRQQQANADNSAAGAQYKIGFQDGYNKAVLDLVKTQLVSPDATPGAAANSGANASLPGPVKDYRHAMNWVLDSFQSVQKRDWEGAIKAASVAIVLNPWDSSPYINRSWAYAESGLIDQAIDDANTALKIDSDNALALNNRAYAMELAGRRAEAQGDYRAACDNSYKAACDTLTQFAKLEAKDLPNEINLLLAKSYSKFQQKDWRAVEQLSTKILLIDPNNATAYVNRAGARTELGNLVYAIEDSNKAIRIAPQLGIAYNNKGYAHERLGQPDQASHYYKRACRLGIEESCLDYERLSSALSSR